VWILDAQDLVLQQRCVHFVVLVAVGTAQVLVLSLIGDRAMGPMDGFVKLVLCFGEDLCLRVEIVGEFQTPVRYEAVSSVCLRPEVL
jgi:hypothetical protein